MRWPEVAIIGLIFCGLVYRRPIIELIGRLKKLQILNGTTAEFLPNNPDEDDEEQVSEQEEEDGNEQEGE